MFENIFHNKTIFVTGHTGFIGSWLTTWLCHLGANVVGFSLDPPTNPSMFDTLRLADDIHHTIGNIQDLETMQKIMSKFEPEIVFHLAAQPLVRLSYEKPIETFNTNIIGTANVLESIKKVPSVKTCVVMTSDKCYENREIQYSYKETDPLGGHDPYSASKGAAEIVVSSYRRSFFSNLLNNDNRVVGISTIRAGNVIGGGDWAEDRIIPDCIRSLISKKPIPIRNPNSVRPWQFVLEPISGMFNLVVNMFKNPEKFSEAWNFGPIDPHMMQVHNLVSEVVKQWKNGEWADVSYNGSPTLHESNILMLDSTKSVTRLNWRPAYSLYESISETIEWYKSYYNQSIQMKEFTLNQIKNYVKNT